MNKSSIYFILHPVGGSLNNKCERGVFEFEHVALVTADSLEEAFIKAQNEFNEDYANLGHRSTSVGDIIENESKYYMVMPLGFAEVPHTVVTYIDWANHVKDPTDLYNDQDAA